MRRRNFIYNTLLGAAGTALAANTLPSCSLFGGDAVIGLIGCGQRGMQLLDHLCGIPAGFQIRRVCDIDQKRRENAVKLVSRRLGYAPELTEDMQAVFADKEVNTVIIATPLHWNALAAIKACRAGKDVYLETLPSLTSEEGTLLKKAAEKYRPALQTGFQHRSAAYCMSARDYIGGGQLGQVVHIKTYSMKNGSDAGIRTGQPLPDDSRWTAWLGPLSLRPMISEVFRDGDYPGWISYWDFSQGHLGYAASNALDLARMVMGDPGSPKEVYGYGSNPPPGRQKEVPQFQAVTYNYDSFTLTCESGVAVPYLKKRPQPGSLNDKTASDWPHLAERIEVYGTKGLMYIGLHGTGWQVIGAAGKITAQEQGQPADQAHLQNFIEIRKYKKELNAPLEQGHLSAMLVHLGNIACRTGNRQLVFHPEKEEFADDQEANKLLKCTYSIPGVI
jgi:predicted dehydrogenase